jgi:hypothetical protein
MIWISGPLGSFPFTSVDAPTASAAGSLHRLKEAEKGL